MIWKNHFSFLYNSVHADHVKLEVLSKPHDGNKCIGFRQVTASCNVACGSGILKVNSPSGSTLQWCAALGWHAIEFVQTFVILEFYIWFPFPHIIAVDMSSCTSLRNFIQIGPPSAERNDVMSIFKMRISAILDCRDPIMGSLKSPVKLKW